MYKSPKPIKHKCTRVTQTYTIPMYKSHPNLYNTNEEESPKPIQYECTRVTQTYTIPMYKSPPNLYTINVQ